MIVCVAVEPGLKTPDIRKLIEENLGITVADEKISNVTMLNVDLTVPDHTQYEPKLEMFGYFMVNEGVREVAYIHVVKESNKLMQTKAMHCCSDQMVSALSCDIELKDEAIIFRSDKPEHYDAVERIYVMYSLGK